MSSKRRKGVDLIIPSESANGSSKSRKKERSSRSAQPEKSSKSHRHSLMPNGTSEHFSSRTNFVSNSIERLKKGKKIDVKD